MPSRSLLKDDVPDMRRPHGTGLPSDPGTATLGPRAPVTPPIAAALQLSHLLSARERAVFELLGAGYDNRSIARRLGISQCTVKRHVTVILAKLGLESRLQAGLAALLTAYSSPAWDSPAPR